MKKIILITWLVVLSVGAFSQSVYNNIPTNQVVKLNGTIHDTIGTSQTDYSAVIENISEVRVNYDLTVRLDTISGGNGVTINREWSMNGDDYFPIDTVTWNGTDADTTISYTNQTFIGQYLRLKYVSDATAQLARYTEWWKSFFSVTPK